jgi:uncharacterized protein YjiS (DUF1127 family)
MAMSPLVPISVFVGLAGAGAILLSATRPMGGSLLDRFQNWRDRQKQRAALLELDARLLRDVGLSREQAEREGRSHD